MDVKGARIVITGASTGIGRAAAIAFAEAGGHIHLIARRTALLEKVADVCRASGVEAHVHTADVRDREAIMAIADEVEALGGADVAIANAGVMALRPFLDMDWADVERQINVNLYGVIHVMQAFGRHMRRRDRGVLMPVSSILAEQALPRYSVYCASKFGVRAVADALAMELRGTGVEVVHVLPGATDTELHSHMDPSDLPRTTREAKRVPPQQVARAMVKAVRRPRQNVLCDGRARLIYWGKRLVPGLVSALVKQATRKG